MLDSFHVQLLCFEPGARSAVECSRRLSTNLPRQLCAQRVCEQVMIAIPTPIVVERDKEQIRPLQLFQKLLTVAEVFRLVPSSTVERQQRVAQRCAQPVKHAGYQQEMTDRWCL